MRALIIAVVLALASPALAQPAPGEPAECFPTCRAGFSCHDGTCVADEAATTPAPTTPTGGVMWGLDSNAPGTGTQALSATASPAPAPPKTPPRIEISAGFTFDALYSSKQYEAGSTEVMGLPNGRHVDHLNKSSPVEFRIREGQRPMLFAVRLGWSLVHFVEKSDSPLRGDSEAGLLIAAQQVFRFPLSSESAMLLDRTLSIDLGVGGFFATQGTLGGIVNATLNIYWLGLGPQVAYGTETKLDLGLRLVTNLAF